MDLEELQIFLFMFADDAILFSQTPQAPQSMLNDIQLYCETWGLRLNVNKTKIMSFENGRHTTHNFSLRKHAYSNILKILSPKIEIFQLKNSNSFHVSAQNIDCGYSLEPPRLGGSNVYSQSVF